MLPEPLYLDISMEYDLHVVLRIYSEAIRDAAIQF